MLSFFKSFKKKPVQKNRTFFERENIIQTIDELNKVLKNLDSDTNEMSDSNIVFQGKELDTIDEKELEKDFGDESFKLYPDNYIDDHVVYFYKMKSEHLRFLIQIHFIKNKFFLAGTRVYSDSMLIESDKLKVINQVINKYASKAEANTIEIHLQDKIGNVLWTNDDVYFHISYLANNSTSVFLKKHYSGLGRKPHQQEILDTLDKII
jgi:hypothetical protein